MAVTARGLIGTGSATSAGTTITVTNTTGATIPAGTFIHITGAWDNINSVTAPTITSSTVGGVAPTANHATAIGSGVTTTAGSGVWHQCFRVLTTGTIASGATIATLTSNQSAVKRAGHAEGFNNCTATLRGTVTTGASAAGTPTVTTTGTALVVGDLAVGSISNENNAQATADADTTGGAWPPIVGIATSGGGAAANVNSGSQYKILTATGTQTFNPTCPATDAVVCVYSLVPVPEPTFTQAAWRMYADGTETGSTALAAQDTAYEADVGGGDVNLQVRVRLQSTNVGAVAATDDYQLQYAKNGGGWNDVVSSGSEAEIDSQATGTASGFGLYPAGSGTGYGQSFVGNGRLLSRVEFFMYKIGSPTGNAVAYLYTHTGSFGSGSLTGSPLASSSPIAAPTFASPNTWVSFAFDGSFELVAGTPYFVVVEYAGQDVSNFLGIRYDATGGGAHAGQAARLSSSVWNIIPIQDCAFKVYGNNIPNNVVPHASANLTDSAVTTNRLGSGTGSFVAGEVSEDGLIDDYLVSANNYTELLYSVTLKQADLTDGDTLTFRIVRNGLTTGLTYTATPTIDIGGGVPNIPGTAQIAMSIATTVAGTVTTPPVVTGTALISSSVDVTVAGTVIAEIVTGTVAITQAVDVAAVGSVTHFVAGTAAIDVAVAATVAGTRTVNGTALIEITGNASATAGARTIFGIALIDVAVSLDVAGTVVAEVVAGTALITASVDVTVAGTVVAEIVAGTALIASSVAVTAAGTVTAEVVSGTALITESVAVTATGTPGVTGTALVSQSIAVTSIGTTVGEAVGTALISVPVTVAVVGRRDVRGTAAITATPTVTVAGTRAAIVTGTATLTAAVDVSVTGQVVAEVVTGTALVTAAVVVSVSVLKVYERAPYTATATFTYTGTVEVAARATANFDYAAGWDTHGTSTVDHDYGHSWELV